MFKNRFETFECLNFLEQSVCFLLLGRQLQRPTPGQLYIHEDKLNKQSRLDNYSQLRRLSDSHRLFIDFRHMQKIVEFEDAEQVDNPVHAVSKNKNDLARQSSHQLEERALTSSTAAAVTSKTSIQTAAADRPR